jgi:hypothetical protein
MIAQLRLRSWPRVAICHEKKYKHAACGGNVAARQLVLSIPVSNRWPKTMEQPVDINFQLQISSCIRPARLLERLINVRRVAFRITSACPRQPLASMRSLGTCSNHVLPVTHGRPSAPRMVLHLRSTRIGLFYGNVALCSGERLGSIPGVGKRL